MGSEKYFSSRQAYTKSFYSHIKLVYTCKNSEKAIRIPNIVQQLNPKFVSLVGWVFFHFMAYQPL